MPAGTSVCFLHFLAMPRCYFNTYDGEACGHEDDIGEEVSSRAAAWEIATRYAAECLRDLDGKLRFNSHWRLEVLKEDRSRLFQITIHADEAGPEDDSQ